jgi:hypothetical protein
MTLISITTTAGLLARLVKNHNGDRTILVRQHTPFEDEIEITLDQAAAIAAIVAELHSPGTPALGLDEQFARLQDASSDLVLAREVITATTPPHIKSLILCAYAAATLRRTATPQAA